jgi:hypothetical protein
MSPCKISRPYDYAFWEKSNARREKREREKTLLIVDSAHEPLKPIAFFI